MTTQELEKLTPKEKRILIAERCPRIVNDGDEDGDAWCWQDDSGTWRDCYRNDPLQDLNAMHAAEKTVTLQWDGRDMMMCKLVDILNPGRIDTYNPERDGAPTLAWHGVFTVAHATAAQRADAFLLCVG